MCPFIVLFLVALATLVLALKAYAGEQGGMATRLPAVVGASLVLFSFAFLPWAKFSPGSYVLDLAPELLGDYLPKVLAELLKLLGAQGLAKVISLLEELIGVPAWLLLIGAWVTVLFVTPSGWPLAVALALAPAVGLATFFWLATTVLFTVRSGARRTAGGIQAVIAGLSTMLLLAQMSAIDALGSAGTLAPRFLLALSGARMSSNVWMAWWGLVLIAVGGLLEAMAQAGARQTLNSDDLSWRMPDEYSR